MTKLTYKTLEKFFQEDTNNKQDQRWNAEQPSATLDP